MKKIKFHCITISIFTFGCASKGVNDTDAGATIPYIAAIASGKADLGGTQRPSPRAGIEGTLLLQGNLPMPLVHVELGLFKQKADGSWEELTRSSTEPGGVFSFTRVLPAGSYEVRILDQRYSGSLPVTLTTSPETGLTLFAEKNER